MLQINLGTRPFYNVRAVQVVLGTVTAIVIGLTLFNVVQTVRLAMSQYTLGASAAQAEAEAARLLSEATRIRAQINPAELAVVANAAREANAIIDQRAFSWTELFAQFEATLPPDVRITLSPSTPAGPKTWMRSSSHSRIAAHSATCSPCRNEQRKRA
jgi:hypothetical protein